MRAWITSLEDYNSGRLTGEWVELDSGLFDAIEAFLAKRSEETGEQHEEWAVHDYDGVPSAIVRWLGGEWPDRDKVEELDGATEDDLELLSAAIECFGDDYVESIEWARERLAGTADSLGDWASDWMDDTGSMGDLPDPIRHNIDWEGVGEYLVNDGGLSHEFHAGRVWVFHNS